MASTPRLGKEGAPVYSMCAFTPSIMTDTSVIMSVRVVGGVWVCTFAPRVSEGVGVHVCTRGCG